MMTLAEVDLKARLLHPDQEPEVQANSPEVNQIALGARLQTKTKRR